MSDKPTAYLALNSADLARLFPGDAKAQQAFAQLFRRFTSTEAAITAGTAATESLQDATVITLSPNTALNQERVLAVNPNALAIEDTGTQVVLTLVSLVRLIGASQLDVIVNAGTQVSIPASGAIPTSGVGPYADDAAAATAGVGIGEWYARPAGVLAWRQV